MGATDRLEKPELALHIWRVVVIDHPRTAADAVIAQLGVALTVDELLESPYYLVGAVHYMVDRLHELRDLYGVSGIHRRVRAGSRASGRNSGVRSDGQLTKLIGLVLESCAGRRAARPTGPKPVDTDVSEALEEKIVEIDDELVGVVG